MASTDKNMLLELINQPNTDFYWIYQQIQNPQKATAEKILIYFDKVTDYLLDSREEPTIKCIHIHFPLVEDIFKEIIQEFIVIKLFYRSLKRDKGQNDYIINTLKKLSAMLGRNHLPPGASAKNGGNKEFREWLREKKNLRSEIEFLQNIPGQNKTLSPNTIINTLISDTPAIENTHFTTSITKLIGNKKAYVLHNTGKFTNLLIALNAHNIVKDIQNIVLFDCAGRSHFNACSVEQLERYKEHGININYLIAISFGKQTFRLKQLIDTSTRIYQKHFSLPQNTIPSRGVYVFYNNEVKKLLGSEIQQNTITWINGADEEVRLFWDRTELLDIPQMRTIYIFNLFMSAISLRIAKKIIENIFDRQENTSIVNSELHEAVLQLTDEEKKELKDTTTLLLQKITNIWQGARKDIVTLAQQNGALAVIVPLPLINDQTFNQELRLFLPAVAIKTYSWKDIKDENIKGKSIISINYKDAGRYPFNIFPNIIEMNTKSDVQFHAFFLSSLFGKRYEQCEREYNTEIQKRLKNSFRSKYLGQEEPTPIQKSSTDGMNFYDIDDQDHDLGEPADTITITYSDSNRITIYPSKAVVIQHPEEQSFRVVRADELSEQEKGYRVQLLEDLYADLNLFQIRPEEESELENLKLKYDATEGKEVLWKVLLVRKLKETSGQTLYKHMAELTGDTRFIGYQYFKDNWLDPQSRLLIPRKRKHFKAICEYLELPAIYYRLKLKKSASEKWNKRNSTQKMTRLLTDMFNVGLFNERTDWSDTNINYLITLHDLEEKGITEDNLTTELQALVALLTENIHLKTIKNIDLP